MLAICPNCKAKFSVGNNVLGVCPQCKLKLLFRAKGEIIEKVDMTKIENAVDSLCENQTESSCLDLMFIEHLTQEEKILAMESYIDDL